MTGERLFLDTCFVQALLNRRDPSHARALALLPRVEAAAGIVVTEAVLLEIANAVSRDLALRGAVAEPIASYYDRPDCTVVPVGLIRRSSGTPSRCMWATVTRRGG